MTRVATTYRMEARLAESDPEIWCRGTVDREQVLEAFTALVGDDAAGDAPMFGPHTGHRLVVLADPPTGTRPNAEAVDDLLAAVPPAVAARVLDEADEVLARSPLYLVGAR